MEQQQNNQRTVFRMPLTTIFEMILLGALCCIGVKECKRADLRLEREKIKHERFMDSINKIKNNSTAYLCSQQRER